MLDHGTRWPPAPDWTSWALRRDDFAVVPAGPLRQHLVSGDLDAFARAAGLTDTGVGAFGLAEGDVYAVRLARDRLLAVGLDGPSVTPGWHAAGYAVTPCPAGLLAFDLSGPGIDGVIARGAAVPLEAAGPSAAMVFAGLKAIVHRRPGALRVHVDRAFAPAFALWLSDLPPILV